MSPHSKINFIFINVYVSMYLHVSCEASPTLVMQMQIFLCLKELFVSTNNKFIASSLSVFVAWVARDTYYRDMRLWIST